MKELPVLWLELQGSYVEDDSVFLQLRVHGQGRPLPGPIACRVFHLQLGGRNYSYGNRRFHIDIGVPCWLSTGTVAIVTRLFSQIVLCPVGTMIDFPECLKRSWLDPSFLIGWALPLIRGLLPFRDQVTGPVGVAMILLEEVLALFLRPGGLPLGRPLLLLDLSGD